MKIRMKSNLILLFFLLSMMACFNSPDSKRNSEAEDEIPPTPPTPEALCDYFFKNTHLSKDTLKQIKILVKKAASIISENDVYNLMNQATFPTDTAALPDSLCTKIAKKTLTFGEHLNLNLLKSLSPTYIELADVLFMFSQISCNATEWDCGRLKNVVCLSQADLDMVFAKRTGEIDSIDYSSEKWKQFRRSYGKYGLHWYSKPIFNEKMDFALIEYRGAGGRGLGSGALLIFQKKDSRWRLVEARELWIT